MTQDRIVSTVTTVSLTPEQKLRIRQLLATQRQRYRSQTEYASALGITQPSLSNLLDLSKPRGVSFEVAKRAAELEGSTVERILGLPGSDGTPPPSVVADPELEAAVAYFDGRWHPAVIAAARKLAESGERRARREWESRLDQIQEALSSVVPELSHR